MSDERHWGREAVRRNREARARPRIVGAWAGTLAALGAAFATDASGTKPGGCSSFCVDATYATACGETSFGFFACVPGETCVAGADYWGCCAAGKSCGGVCE